MNVCIIGLVIDIFTIARGGGISLVYCVISSHKSLPSFGNVPKGGDIFGSDLYHARLPRFISGIYSRKGSALGILA